MNNIQEEEDGRKEENGDTVSQAPRMESGKVVKTIES